MGPLEVSSNEKTEPLEAGSRPGTEQRAVLACTEMMMSFVHRRNSAD
jgi:hypothetical protein